MRAACVADDLPKLKAFPWERLFRSPPQGEAIDLAQRLLCYDPDQRLSATRALGHPFFDGAGELVEAGGAGPGGLTPSPSLNHRESSGPRRQMGADEWGRRLSTYFEDARGIGARDPLYEKVVENATGAMRKVSGEQPESVAHAVAKQFGYDLKECIKQRDEKLRQLHASLLRDSQECEMPRESAAGAAGADGGGGGGPSGGGGGDGGGGDDGAEAAKLKEQIDGLKGELSALSRCQAEKAELGAQLCALQAQLDAFDGHATPMADAGGGRDTDSPAQGNGPESEGGRANAPGFGRRAPAMPTRQATTVEGVGGVGVSPVVMPPHKMQTDNMGQVAPLGALSPGSEASPNIGSRPGVHSARRRSRLAGEKDGDELVEEAHD